MVGTSTAGSLAATDDLPLGRLGKRPGVGFVGAGFMGDVHTRAARASGAEVLGVVASRADRAEEAARLVGATDRSTPYSPDRTSTWCTSARPTTTTLR